MSFYTNEELLQISNSESTNLCKIMNKYGSDKGSGHHNYTKLYHQLFNNLYNQASDSKTNTKQVNILEIGIGSINPYIPSNMAPVTNYKPGASQYGWAEYFSNGNVYCGDIDQTIISFPHNSRIKGYFIDQRNPQQIIQFLQQIKDIKFDIIIDDGLHDFPINLSVLKLLYHKLKPNGYYIIEDIWNYTPYNLTFSCTHQYIKFPNPKNNVDNNILLIQSTLSNSDSIITKECT
jgi:hypothetical protein